MATELKPCPFCGGEAKIRDFSLPDLEPEIDVFAPTVEVRRLSMKPKQKQSKHGTGGKKMETQEFRDDMEFVMDIMTEIAEYAMKNQMIPDETIKTVAENMIALLEIITLNEWRKERQ